VDPSTPPWRALEAASGSPSATAPAASGGSLRGWLPIVCFGLAIVLAVAAFVVAVSGAGGVVEVDGADIVTAADPSGAAGPTIRAALVVEVSGAVAKPGVYRLADGARIIDAIEAAGGFGPRVDMARADAALNLAAPIHDGDELHVPSRDDAAVPVPSSGAAGSTGASGGLIDLNTATDAQLDSLPGVGPATVAKIVGARPFATVDELQAKGVVGEKTLEKLRPLVTVGS
jgi:competence protein ComEA